MATALDVLAALEAQLGVLRHQLVDAARHLAGAKVLAERLYGVGPATALAMTCWLGGRIPPRMHHIVGPASQQESGLVTR